MAVKGSCHCQTTTTQVRVSTPAVTRVAPKMRTSLRTRPQPLRRHPDDALYGQHLRNGPHDWLRHHLANFPRCGHVVRLLNRLHDGLVLRPRHRTVDDNGHPFDDELPVLADGHDLPHCRLEDIVIRTVGCACTAQLS